MFAQDKTVDEPQLSTKYYELFAFVSTLTSLCQHFLFCVTCLHDVVGKPRFIASDNRKKLEVLLFCNNGLTLIPTQSKERNQFTVL